MKRLFVSTVFGVVGLFGCGAGEPARDHAGADEDVGELGAPVSCNPGLARYPVAGPHNGGYDANALNYTCPVHPGGSPDNSDYIGGQHFGNDLFGAKGTPIVAPVKGTIAKAGWDTTGGNRVTVQDGCGWHYYHAHLDSIAVSVGQSVNPGDVLGTLGNSGSAQGTSPHLHFSIYPEAYDSGIDPFPYLQAVDGTSCGCKPHCEGSKIHGSDCGVGDCGAYGATCVDDSKGVRCASVFCPAQGQKKVCVSDALIGDCNDGAIGVGDCSAYGAGCVDDAKGARCVVVFCLSKPAKAHDVCIPDGSSVTATTAAGSLSRSARPARRARRRQGARSVTTAARAAAERAATGVAATRPAVQQPAAPRRAAKRGAAARPGAARAAVPAAPAASRRPVVRPRAAARRPAAAPSRPTTAAAARAGAVRDPGWRSRCCFSGSASRDARGGVPGRGVPGETDGCHCADALAAEGLRLRC